MRLSGCFVVLFAAGLLSAQSTNYMPLNERELGRPFPLKRLAVFTDKSAPLSSRAGPAGSTFEFIPSDPEIVSLKGADKSGRPWRVAAFEYYGCSGGTVIYESDLDGDHTVDAVLIAPTCGNGLSPQRSLQAITFDRAGRPVPFEIEGYFEELADGIRELVDLNRDGAADLVAMNFDDGYWITNGYSLHGARWRRVQGAFGRRSFPLYTRFTNRPNRRAVTPSPTRHPWAADVSNEKSVLSGTLRAWSRAPNPAFTNIETRLTVRDAKGVDVGCVPQDAILVSDQPEGRTVERLSRATDEFLAGLVKDKARLQLFGRRIRGACSPELVWIDAINR